MNKLKKLKLSLVLTIIALTLVLPVYAGRADYRARGKLVAYDPPQPTSEVVNGNWNVVVNGDDVDFRAFYRERNLDAGFPEYSPVGSIDHFWITLTEGTAIIDEDECVITGTFYVRKLWRTLPDEPLGYPIVWKDPLYVTVGTVNIDSDGIQFDFQWNLEGTTLSIQN